MNKLKLYLNNFHYASMIIFAASRKYFIYMLALSLIGSVLLYIPLFLWRELINGLALAVGGDLAQLGQTVWVFAFGYVAVMLLGKLLDTVSEFVAYKYNDAIQYYLDNLMIEKVAAMDLAFFDSSDLKDKLNNSWSLIFSIKNMVTFVFDIVQKAIRLMISFSLMLTLSFWLIPVIALLCVPSVISDRKVNELDYQFQKEHEKAHRRLEYYKELFFEGARQEVRLYGLKDYFSSLYVDEWTHWDRALHAKDRKTLLIHLISLFILAVNDAIVYVLSVAKLAAGKIAVGDVAYYVALLAQFREDFTSLCYRINMFKKNSDEINDVRSFVEMKPMLEKSGTRTPGSNPRIEFKEVSFRYPNAEREALNKCSFVIEPGEKVGLVGLNGSGKSTIVKLLCRFYDPTDGQILIDGTDNREYDITKLRRLFGVLFQDYVRYSFTLRENIALSDLSRSDDTAAISQACAQSMAEDFVKDWENGIDEPLTRRFDQNGKELSGGQWQKVSLARAFFRNAPVVLLDEPSAALDPIAEHEIFQEFDHISTHKSAVLISHRLSNITVCDKILFLEDGQILEQGTHRELLAQGGHYAHLFYLQASKYKYE